MSLDESSVASTYALETTFKDLREGNAALLPQCVAVVGQGASAESYPLEKWQATSAAAAGDRYGYGSPIHLALLQLQPANGDGLGTIPVFVLPLEDAYEGVAATGRITPTGTATAAKQVRVKINNIPTAWFVVDEDDTVATIVDKIVAAVNAVVAMPAIAADVTTYAGFTAKWAGVSSNGIKIEVESEAVGVTYAVQAMAGGLADPAIEDGLALIGEQWVTMMVNCMSIANTDALDAYKAEGEARWDSLVRKPFVSFVGNTEPVVGTATATPLARPTDRVNAMIPVPGSNNLPLQIAARAVAKIAKVANSVPAKSYQKQILSGIIPGTDAQQWAYAARDQAVKAGSSTITVADSEIKLSDVVTFWHPTGENPPGYRYVVNIVKLQNAIYNFDNEFQKEEWASAPVVSDSDVVVEPEVKQPSMYVAKANQLLVGLGKRAIIANVAAAKKKTRARLNANNPNRVDLDVEFPVSSNGNITSVNMTFGYLFA